MTEQEFLRTYDALADAIFRHCYYRVYDREQARDLAQETFTRTWAYLAAGQEVKNIRAFLYRVANNLIIDESRKKKSLSLDELQEAGWEPSSQEHLQLDVTVDAAAVVSIIRQLPPDQRDILIMRYVDNLSPKEIGKILDLSANVISVRIHRAMHQLRQLLNPSHESDS